jgi:hypothetical protein
MRHVGTLIAAIVIAPLAWILLAFGQDRSAEAFANAQRAGVFHTGDFVRPVQFLAAAGLLLGLIATLRFSPLGALLTGAWYVSSYALLLVAPNGLLSLFSHDLSIAGHHADPTTPIRTGTTLLLGTLLLVGVASVGRWRRWPRRGVDPFETAARDRPLGADGLGLTPPTHGAEPEMVVRYPTRPARTAGAGSRWAASLRGHADEARW